MARTTVVVAAVYGYFLIFAQFAFLDLLGNAGVSHGMITPVLAVMVAGGVAGGFIAASQVARRGVSGPLRKALAAAALVAALSLHVRGWLPAMVLSAATGGTLGVATVTLAGGLRGWLRGACAPLWVGLGTGLAYAVCNAPFLFDATPVAQAWAACAMAMLGAVAVPPEREADAAVVAAGGGPRFLPWLLVFLALVWLDSAAFWVIQHQAELKGGTWGGGWRLWRNAAVHLTGGVAAGLWLSRGGLRPLLLAAGALLGMAALAVNQAATREVGGLFYPLAVSLYSTALAAWPGLFSGAVTPAARARKAAWLFAVAGWFGSANGIGMATRLQRVPVWFVLAAAAVVLLALAGPALRRRWREALAIVFTLGIAATAGPRAAVIDQTHPSAARGHEVYVAEGCIHCHSRYVRPGSPDEAAWGDASVAAKATRESPVLIGNRRHGPDLANIAGRRSDTWLRLHFLDPRALRGSSVMPSYAHLFDDRRGDDLIAFLRFGAAEATAGVLQHALAWRPDPAAKPADPARGHALFGRHCVACHGPQGKGNGPLAERLAKRPADLTDWPLVWSAPRPGEPREVTVARIIKFGLPGTDMPGHETMSDEDLLALARRVTEGK